MSRLDKLRTGDYVNPRQVQIDLANNRIKDPGSQRWRKLAEAGAITPLALRTLLRYIIFSPTAETRRFYADEFVNPQNIDIDQRLGKVRNPKTGRWVAVTGDAGQRVIREYLPKEGPEVPGQILKYEVKGEDLEHQYLVRELLERNDIRGRVRVVLVGNKQVWADVTYNIPREGPSRKWWVEGQYGREWAGGAGGYEGEGPTLFERADADMRGEDHITLVFLRPSDIPAREIAQQFADGVSHCVFSPILSWAQQCHESAKSPQARSRYLDIIGKCQRYSVEYAAGVPQDRMQDVASDLRLDFSIADLTGNVYLEYKSTQKAIRRFRYLNNRLNHVEEGVLASDQSQAVEVSADELRAIYEDNRETCYFVKAGADLCAVHTTTGVYKRANPFADACARFEEEEGLDKSWIDHFAQPELSDFVRKGAHVSGCVDYQPDLVQKARDGVLARQVSHIDQSRCYTQFEHAPFYVGFPLQFTDFRRVDSVDFACKHVGYYACDDFDLGGCSDNVRSHLQKLGIYSGATVLPTPEIRFLVSLGAKLTVSAGCWGVGSAEFRFNDEMVNMAIDWHDGSVFDKRDSPDREGIRFYSKWAGKCHMLRSSRRVSFHLSSTALASQYKHKYGSRFSHYEYDGTATVEFDKSTTKHRSHIFGFITSYARLNLLSQLFEIPHGRVLRVVMDGIYFLGDTRDIVVHDTFRRKPAQFPANTPSDKFFHAREPNLPTAEFREHFRAQYCHGKAGAGKTRMNLTDKGLCGVVYCSPGWDLAREKEEKYGCSATVLARLLGRGTECPFTYSPPATIIVDEATMLTEGERKTIFRMYPFSKLIFCGDVDSDGIIYQLPPPKGAAMELDEFDSLLEVVAADGEGRCKDPALGVALDKIRAGIKAGYGRFRMSSLLKELFPVVDHASVAAGYGLRDYILCSRRSCKKCNQHWCGCDGETDNYVQEWTDRFRDQFPEEKYMVTRSDNERSNGEIVISAEPVAGAEVRHAFTIHAIQGKDCSTKIYIDLRNMFDVRMAYTAASRASYAEQVVLVE